MMRFILPKFLPVYLALVFIAIDLGSCSSFARAQLAVTPTSREGLASIAQSVSVQKSAGATVVKTAMVRISRETILKGSCYDFVDAVYRDAGFPEKKRKRIYAAKQAGPYADISLIRGGDWIYYDHMYAVGADHSIIFVAWIDFENHVALAIDYAGANRSEPGRYRVVDLFKVWGITRPTT